MQTHALEVNIHVTLFILTTTVLLFHDSLYSNLANRQTHSEGFNRWNAGKVFGAILGLGFIAFLAVYYLIFYVRFAIIAVAGFFFGGIFMFLAKAVRQ